MQKTKRFRWLRCALIVIMVCELAILPQTILSQARQIFTVNSTGGGLQLGMGFKHSSQTHSGE